MYDMYRKAAQVIRNAKRVTAFTGAGISVESGIPPFRGKDGLWNKYDPVFLSIDYFLKHPKESWELIKEIFFDFFGQAEPNDAHDALARMEQAGLLQAIITQNIDNLHQEAGSKTVYEFHGTSRTLACVHCGKKIETAKIDLHVLPPHCLACGDILKPDFVFFGEAIPEPTNTLSFQEAGISDVFLLIGTTGEIMPASVIPQIAKKNGATIIEVNSNPSNYTNSITDVFLHERATVAMNRLCKHLGI
ncbi:MAG: NAD-dependent deacylase [Deltaproteobacteria bacterium]|nr:NAD-dependent deacylase [Deltaproteobacteria bacterium]